MKDLEQFSCHLYFCEIFRNMYSLKNEEFCEVFSSVKFYQAAAAEILLISNILYIFIIHNYILENGKNDFPNC